MSLISRVFSAVKMERARRTVATMQNTAASKIMAMAVKMARALLRRRFFRASRNSLIIVGRLLQVARSKTPLELGHAKLCFASGGAKRSFAEVRSQTEFENEWLRIYESLHQSKQLSQILRKPSPSVRSTPVRFRPGAP